MHVKLENHWFLVYSFSHLTDKFKIPRSKLSAKGYGRGLSLGPTSALISCGFRAGSSGSCRNLTHPIAKCFDRMEMRTVSENRCFGREVECVRECYLGKTIGKTRARLPYCEPERCHWLAKPWWDWSEKDNETQALACSGVACRMKFLISTRTGLARVMVTTVNVTLIHFFLLCIPFPGAVPIQFIACFKSGGCIS